ncbi:MULTISPECIES: hypothetical protein [Rheinheimera]|jgi:hypothetical protein|nr:MULTISPECIES: hypothetical protein [Rheinheimera]GGM66109.1 hypothetical protein GCM10010920_28590 [Rheinheimera tangshanensis]
MKELNKSQLTHVFGGAFLAYTPGMDYQEWLEYYNGGYLYP